MNLDPSPYSNDGLDDWSPDCPQCQRYRESYENWLKDRETMRGRAKAWCEPCCKWVRN